MKKWSLRAALVLLVASSAVVASASASAARTDGSKPIVVTFQKHLVDPANLVFQGTTGGRVKGDLVSNMLPGSLTIDGAIWHFTFDWIVTANSKHKSFIARTTGDFDTSTGSVVMDGSVIQGWHLGAPVHEEGLLIDPATFTFAGVIVISPGDDED